MSTDFNTTHEPFECNALHGGTQHRYQFDNGYGASVVSHRYSYGGDEGQWELAVTTADGRLCYDTPITCDVIGRLEADEVGPLLDQVAALPNVAQVTQ